MQFRLHNDLYTYLHKILEMRQGSHCSGNQLAAFLCHKPASDEHPDRMYPDVELTDGICCI